MVDLTGLLQELLIRFTAGLPGLFTAIVLVILGFIVAGVVSRIVKRVLLSLKIDVLGDKLNEIEMVSKANIEVKISTVLSKAIYYVVLLIFLIAATDVLGMPVLSELVMDIFTLIPSLLVAGVILVVGILFADAIRSLVKTACDSLGIPSGKLISMLIFYFIVINVLVSALTQANINTEFLAQNISLIIGGAILAFAIGYGLASKTTVSNFLAAQYVNDKIKVGDTITINGTSGLVVAMDKSSVCLDTGTAKIYVPMHQLIQESVEVK